MSNVQEIQPNWNQKEWRYPYTESDKNYAMRAFRAAMQCPLFAAIYEKVAEDVFKTTPADRGCSHIFILYFKSVAKIRGWAYEKGWQTVHTFLGRQHCTNENSKVTLTFAEGNSVIVAVPPG